MTNYEKCPIHSKFMKLEYVGVVVLDDGTKCTCCSNSPRGLKYENTMWRGKANRSGSTATRVSRQLLVGIL